MIKPGALLINVSQPQLIDRAALIQALAAGRLSGFGLDTFYDEPGQAHDPLGGLIQVEARSGERMFLTRPSLVAVTIRRLEAVQRWPVE